MKKYSLMVSLAALCALFMCSCAGPGPVAGGLDESKDCLLDSLELSVTGRVRHGSFTWKNGLPATAWMRWPSGVTRDIVYKYDDANKLVSSTDRVGGNTFTYTYEGDRLVRIDASSDEAAITFEYGPDDRILRQIFITDGKLTRIMKFAYDEEGLPISNTTIDPSTDEPVSRFDFTYSPNPNPLSPFGLSINVFESSYGYPVGTCNRQLTSATINFLRDSRGPVNNQQKAAGDAEEILWTCEYNEHGWPQYWRMERGKMLNEARMFYSCPE